MTPPTLQTVSEYQSEARDSSGPTPWAKQAPALPQVQSSGAGREGSELWPFSAQKQES